MEFDTHLKIQFGDSIVSENRDFFKAHYEKFSYQI